MILLIVVARGGFHRSRRRGETAVEVAVAATCSAAEWRGLSRHEFSTAVDSVPADGGCMVTHAFTVEDDLRRVVERLL